MKISESKLVKPGKIFRNTIVASLLVVTISIALFHEPLLINYGQWLAPSNPQPIGDVVVCLGGGNRIETALSLLASGQVKALYTDAIDPKQLQEIVTKSGLPSHKIYWGGYAKNTFDEALAFRRTMNSANVPYHQVVIVSDRYHLRRSQWAFRQVLGSDVAITTHAIPANEAMSDPRWWKHQESLDWVISETRKSLFYYLYYGLFGSRKPLSPRDLALLSSLRRVMV
ncbi:MAG: YdcF family protein [Stigonema ocellatum SAG 48.90 = DSM 106950]|nr:YdcF family protein [Stigonema ocellatum SAG 48.90 = DSM 106950]